MKLSIVEFCKNLELSFRSEARNPYAISQKISRRPKSTIQKEGKSGLLEMTE